jgi:hypothetical protein
MGFVCILNLAAILSDTPESSDDARIQVAGRQELADWGWYSGAGFHRGC